MVLSGKSCLSLRRQSCFPSPRRTIATMPFLRQNRQVETIFSPQRLILFQDPNRTHQECFLQGPARTWVRRVILCSLCRTCSRQEVAAPAHPRQKVCLLEDSGGGPCEPLSQKASPCNSPHVGAALLFACVFMLKDQGNRSKS